MPIGEHVFASDPAYFYRGQGHWRVAHLSL